MTPLSALMQGNLPRIWTLARALIETFDVPEVTTFIGTMQDAMAQQQAQQAAAAQQQQLMQQAELMKQVFSHTDFKQPTASRQPGGGNGQAAAAAADDGRRMTRASIDRPARARKAAPQPAARRDPTGRSAPSAFGSC